MNTSSNGYPDRRRRRTHSAEFKAKVVAACRKPGMSIATVALDHRLNANLLRRWAVATERAEQSGVSALRNMAQAGSIPLNAAFVPVAVHGPVMATAQEIVIELRRGSTVVKVSWPLAAAPACGAWLGELLR